MLEWELGRAGKGSCNSLHVGSSGSSRSNTPVSTPASSNGTVGSLVEFAFPQKYPAKPFVFRPLSSNRTKSDGDVASLNRQGSKLSIAELVADQDAGMGAVSKSKLFPLSSK